MKIREKKKIGLVLSGGGIKAAAFHIGVCMALREKGFHFAGGPRQAGNSDSDHPLSIQLYVGSSAGAFVSSILAAGYGVESLINAFQLGSGQTPSFNSKDLTAMKPLSYRHIFSVNGRSFLRFMPQQLIKKSLVTGGLESLIKNGFKLNGLFSTQGLERYLRKYVFIENDFSRLNAELYIIATQLNHTRKVIFSNFQESFKTSSTSFINYASISEAVACSTSLPPIFSPYGLKQAKDDKVIYYYDGEIRETLSAHVAADHGCDLVISSYSMQPYHYTEEMGSLHEYGIPVILNQALYQVLEQKTSKHIEWQGNLKQIYKTIDSYFKQNKLPDEHREKLLENFRTRFNYRPEVDYIYITPRPENYEMFFVDHFSLNPRILERIVRMGFKSALGVLRRYEI